MTSRRRNRTVRRVWVLFAALVVGLYAAPSLAVPPGDPAGVHRVGPYPPPPVPRRPPAGREVRRGNRVTVKVMVVYATDSTNRVDPRLGSLTRYLTHLRFSGYELLDTHVAQVAPNSTQTFSIEGNRKFEVTLLAKDANRCRVRVQVTAGRGGKLLDTTLSVNRNGTFIVAGPRYKDGILVLPLTVRY